MATGSNDLSSDHEHAVLDVLTNPKRLRALRRYRVITTPQAVLDRIARLAGRLTDAPIALLTLLGEEKQVILAGAGTDREALPAKPSVCRYTIASNEPVVVEDLSSDRRFADEYYVTGELHLRFYAGAPLTTSDGHRIGTLCVYDRESRTPRRDLSDDLEDLAETAMHVLEEGQYSLSDEPELTQTVLDHLPGIFYVVGRDGAMKRWNARFEDVTGYGPDELKGREALSFFEGEDRDRVEAAIREVFDDGATQVEASLIPRSGSPVPMIFTGVKTHVRGEPRLVGMGVDISAQKEKERELTEAKEDAEAARREATRQRKRAEEASASKSRFLAGVAHDLKTPVSAIRGYAQMLSRRLEGDPQAFVDRIDRAAKQITEMSDSLTEIARLQAGAIDVEPEPVDVACLLRGVHADLGAGEADPTFRLDLREGAPPARGHAGMLKRAVTNLAENALTYSGREDRVTLRLVVDARAQGDDAGPEHPHVVVEVEDTGPGIDPDFQERMFEPFARNAPETDGTGLGLAVSRELVEAMGGRLDVDSAPGEGTTVRITLPAGSGSG